MVSRYVYRKPLMNLHKTIGTLYINSILCSGTIQFTKLKIYVDKRGVLTRVYVDRIKFKGTIPEKVIYEFSYYPIDTIIRMAIIIAFQEHLIKLLQSYVYNQDEFASWNIKVKHVNIEGANL